MNWASIYTVVVAVGGLLLICVGLWRAAKGSYNKATMEALRADIDDWKDRDERKDRIIAEMQLKQANQEQRIDGLQRENEMLKELVTQKARVDEIAKELRSHRDESIIWINQILTIVSHGEVKAIELPKSH